MSRTFDAITFTGLALCGVVIGFQHGWQVVAVTGVLLLCLFAMDAYSVRRQVRDTTRKSRDS